MSRISVNNLTFSYLGCGDYIFKDVSFNLDSDWKLGFCGRNGRGKTTFLRLLMGELEYSGTISSNLKFEYFPFKVENLDYLVVDIIESIAINVERWQIIKELNKLSLDEEILYRVYNSLSGGEQTKILLVALFLKENSFLLIDEPTNHLSLESRQIVAKYLNSKSGFILVSHDRVFLDSCTDHTLSINKCNIEITKGSFSVWFKQKEQLDNFELNKNEQLLGEIERLKKSSQESKNWSQKAEKSKFEPQKSGLSPDRGFLGKKAQKLMKHSKSIQKRSDLAIKEKSKLLKNIENTPQLNIIPLKNTVKRLVNISNLSIFYNDCAILNGFNLCVNDGERVAIIGNNGAGKSSILKLIAGENIAYSGEFSLASGIKISYVSQNISNLGGNLNEYAIKHEIEPSLLNSMLHKLGLDSNLFLKDISELSMGQKKKVLIAKSLCQKANLYIFDEPLNYIDIYSRIQIEKMLINSSITMLFCEHDEEFMQKISTQSVKILTS